MVVAEDKSRPVLLCLPHAGGTARAFIGLSRAFPGHRVVPLELPGHGMRMREPFARDLATAVDDLARQAAPHVGGEYLLLGHSLGAALAFEVARHWSRAGRSPAGLVLVGRNGPGAPLPYEPIHRLDTAAFLDGIRRLGGTPPQLFENPELVHLFAPVLRSALTLSETYQPLPGRGEIDCPLWLCAGEDDPLADRDGMLDWTRFAAGPVTVDILPGGHFILDDAEFHAFLSGVLALSPAAV